MSDDKVLDRVERLARENGRLQADIRAMQADVAAMKAARPASGDFDALLNEKIVGVRAQMFDEYHQKLAPLQRELEAAKKAEATLQLLADAADFEVAISRYTDGRWTACIPDGPLIGGYDLDAVLKEAIANAEDEE